MKKTYYLLLTVITVFLSVSLKAQVTTSQISGKVTDVKGGAMPGVSITIANIGNGTHYNTQTNTDGRYSLNNLNPGGPYTITASFVGFLKDTHEGLNLSLGSNTLNLQLIEEATALKEVVVSAQRGGTKTGAGTRVNQDQIKQLPTLSRSLQDLTRLTPQSSNNSFQGTNFRYNNVTLDGAINNDAIGFSPSLGGQTNSSGQMGSSTRTNPVSLDAIQDIQVYVAPFDIKIGNVLGGSINAVTRSGTNDVTGSVYGYGRGAFMIGPNNAGDKSKEPSDFHEYQSGFRLGLPIVKNKLFFFTNDEITRRQDPIIMAAGSADAANVIDLASAQAISAKMTSYGFSAGTFDNTSIYSNSNKFFNRLDWNINDKNQLTIRNNTIKSTATNLERDQQNFRFGSIDYTSHNNQNSTVAELKSRFGNSSTNSMIFGYSAVHDYRDPTSNPALPQIEITGLKPGTTIFLGTDREAAIFDMRQKTFEFTDNFTFVKGNNTFTLGTHNEFYDIQYGFVNAWNGRIAYSSIANFLSNTPSRTRANYNYSNDTRNYILANPSAKFNVNLLSLYGQDEIQMGDRFKFTAGLRLDYADVPNKQPLSTKTTSAPVDANYGKTYTYTKPKDIRNDFLGNIEFSPRIGFNYDANGDQSFIVRGGSGLFTGRIPFAWLGYAYYNNGVTYGAFDVKPAAGTIVGNPVQAPENGGAGYAAQQPGTNVTDPALKTQVDMIDNNFKMPQVWRSNVAFDFTTASKFKITLEGIYTKVIHDLEFQQVNYADNVTYYPYDTNHQQPIFINQNVNPLYTNAYLLSNTSQGHRYSLTAQVAKAFGGFDASVAYTYGQSKDITNGIRNSMESNWQLNQALNPNSPVLSNSNFDIRNRIVSTLNYKINSKSGKSGTNFALFFSSQSGTPYSFGFLPSAIDGTGQQVSLAYIPKTGETVNFFSDVAGGQTAVQQAAVFDAYIDANKYLSGHRGQFTERNGARTPWNTTADFRFTQNFNFAGKGKRSLTFTMDVINLTNLLNSNWGKLYFSPNTFNSTSSIGLTPKTTPSFATASATYPKYTFADPGKPYSVDLFASRYQMQFGLRYSF